MENRRDHLRFFCLLINKNHRLYEFRMKAFSDRTVVCGFFDKCAFFFCEICRKSKVADNFPDSSWLTFHDFLQSTGRAVDVDAVLLSEDGDGRQRAFCKRCGAEIGGRKFLALPVIVFRRVAFNYRSRL